MILLRVIFIAQLVLMLPAFASLLLTPVHLGTVAVLFYLAPVGLLTVLYGLWQFIRYPARRRLATATAATPFLCLATPLIVTLLNGGPAEPAALIAVVIVLLAITALVLLAKTAQWRAGGLFFNRRFNLTIVIVLGVLFLLLWFPVIAWLASDRSYTLPSNLADRDWVLLTGGLYYFAIAVPGLLLSLFTLLYAPVGLMRNAGGRLAHFGQLVLTLMLLASLIVVAFAVYIGIVNPG